MRYPLHLSFKIIAVAPQVHLTDADGKTVCFVRQKLFKLKESVQVFSDTDRQNELCQIGADRIIDFSACYRFTDPSGREFGAVRRKGMRSIFKAHYEILDGDAVCGEIREANAWVKFFDGLLSGIPVVGILSSYLLHPTYTVSRPDGTAFLQMRKRPAFWEGKFAIEKLGELEQGEEMRAFMSLIMLTLLERRRG